LNQRVATTGKNASGLPSTPIQQTEQAVVKEPEKRIAKTASSAAAKPTKAIQPADGMQSSVAEKTMSEGPVTQPSALFQAGSAFANTETAHALSSVSAVGSPGRPHWRIDSLGQVQRSFGDGAWQPVLANAGARMRVVAVFESRSGLAARLPGSITLQTMAIHGAP